MSPPAPTGQPATGRTVLLVRCVECGHVKELDERGWVTVLSPSGSRRIHYCSTCIEDLVRRASTADEVDDYGDDK
jgi:hypothetical protein